MQPNEATDPGEDVSPEPLTTSAAAKAARAGAGWVNTLLQARKFTKRHDRLALRAYEDALEWVKAERAAQLPRLAEVDATTDDDSYYGPRHVERQYEAREPSAQRWRAKRLETQRKIEDLADRENIVHAAIRRFGRRPWPPPNPHQDETDALTANWDHGVQPRAVPPPPEAFAALVEHLPALGKIYRDVASLPDPGDTPSFCANRLWYHRVKSLVVERVGYEATIPELMTTKAYDTAYQTLYRALPHCRNCGEASMEDLFPYDDWWRR